MRTRMGHGLLPPLQRHVGARDPRRARGLRSSCSLAITSASSHSFYARHHGRVVFASEIKAILQDETFPREVDEQQMYEYLRFGLFDHNDGTFFRGIRQVPAAAFAIVEGGAISETTYWTPRLSEDGDANPETFRAVFERAVQRRLVADVPVGICLSGGLDSSSICTVMARQLHDHVPDTKSLGDRLQDLLRGVPRRPHRRESRTSRACSTSPAPTRAPCNPTDQDFIRELEAWVWHMEEPMVSSAPFAMWMVMRLARRQVTVTLDGQAGDELLAGYDHYPYVLLRQLLRERRYAEFAHEAWLLRDIVGPLVRRRLRERGQRVDVASMLAPAFTRGRKPPEDDRVADDLKRRLLQDFRTYSLPPLLRYEDRASMAHSLEARLPFLDQELVDYILTLPRSAIIHNGWTRAIVRQALHGTLPTRRRATAQEDRLHHAGIPLVPAPARGAAEPHALAVVPRSTVLEGRGGGGGLPSRMRRRGRGVDVLLARGERRGVAAHLHRRLRRARSTITAITAASSRRGDQATAAKVAGGQAMLDGARLNWGRHLFLEDKGRIWARFPLRSALIKPGADLIAGHRRQPRALSRRAGVADRGRRSCCSISEKALAISQGRSYPIDEIPVSRAAAAALALREPRAHGRGARASRRRCSSRSTRRAFRGSCSRPLPPPSTKPFGMRGIFYRVAGHGVNAIDGPVVAEPPAVRQMGDQSRRSIRPVRRCASRRRFGGAPDGASASPSSTPTTWPPRCSRPSASTPSQFWP